MSKIIQKHQQYAQFCQQKKTFSKFLLSHKVAAIQEIFDFRRAKLDVLGNGGGSLL
jgi:hypothetical protein